MAHPLRIAVSLGRREPSAPAASVQTLFIQVKVLDCRNSQTFTGLQLDRDFRVLGQGSEGQVRDPGGNSCWRTYAYRAATREEL